jgi:hypothetical protein
LAEHRIRNAGVVGSTPTAGFDRIASIAAENSVWPILADGAIRSVTTHFGRTQWPATAAPDGNRQFHKIPILGLQYCGFRSCGFSPLARF